VTTGPEAGAVRTLLPVAVAVAVAEVDDRPTLYPDEAALVASAGHQRRREFAAGRVCAHAALRTLGRDGEPIGRGRRGEPLWPAGVVGSISHAGGLAAAAAALVGDAWAVGLDIESLDPPLSPPDERFVLAGAAASTLGGDDHPLAPYRAKIAFSAKETVFKCVYPHTEWMLEFGDVDLSLDLDNGAFVATLDSRFCAAPLTSVVLAGRFAVSQTHIFTALWLPPPPGPH
jgi:4'-phosphopantetheinyl transferase EntD